jgi:hypothetical protein
MIDFRLLRAVATCLPCAVLTGCVLFSPEAWQGPSPLSAKPPTAAHHEKLEDQGGFTVLVEAPGSPPAARVMADVGTFALRRGFARQGVGTTGTPGLAQHPGEPSVPETYVLDNIQLDVAYRASDLRVVARLHSSRLSRKFVDAFCRDFDQEYGKRYGEDDPIIEDDFVDDGRGAFRGNGGHGVPSR